MIQGDKKERKSLPELTKKVGLFEAKVVAINPTAEEFKDVLGIELAENSKLTEYLTPATTEKKTTLRVDVWLEEIKSKQKFKLSFFLVDEEIWTGDKMKKQYINNIGKVDWASDENNLSSWFTQRDYRVAHRGEENFYDFLRIWLGELDYTKDSTVLELDWKKLMKGNVKDLKDQVDGAYCTNVVALATIQVREKDGETVTYQNVFNGAFLPAYYLKNFRLVNYNDEKVKNQIVEKLPKELKPVEKFVKKIVKPSGGCKDFYILSDLQDYDAQKNFAASDAVISKDGSDF